MWTCNLSYSSYIVSNGLSLRLKLNCSHNQSTAQTFKVKGTNCSISTGQISRLPNTSTRSWVIEMVRGGAMKEENAEMEERKRLKRLALKNNLLSDRQASSATGSHPSKIVMKHHGKDIMKKSQRSGKNRFLFSFPGLLAPISGGKIGELKDLGTKNPILYLDFPQVNTLKSFLLSCFFFWF